MTVIEQPAPAATRQHGGASRYAGLAFAVLYLAGFVTLVTGPTIYEDGSLTEYAAAHANGDRSIPVSLVAFVIWPLAGACLIWAVAHISSVMPGATGGPSVAGRIARAGAVVMAGGLTVAGAAAGAAAHLATGTGDGFPPDPGTAYGLEMLGSQVMSASMWGGSLVLLAVGIGGRRSGRVPGWLLWAGIVVAPLLVVAWVLFMLPLLAYLVWVAVVGAIVKTGPIATTSADRVVS